MATLTMSPAVRQPFASVDAPRIRSLLKTKMNLSNKQNGASPISLKRPAASDSDSENVDPAILGLSNKRKRSSEDDMSKETLKPIKTSRFVLTTVESNVARNATPLNTRTNRASTPASTPVKPAGRSPQLKARKVFGRRSVNTTSRVEPAFAKRPAVSRAPFSITTALATGKSKASSRSKPSSWFFDIHVDSEQDEMTNLVQHSTCVLDISDDEGKTKADGRGKENIPPHELGIQLPGSTNVSIATSRKNMKTSEPRSPLGELDTTDYYGDGCDSLSCVIIYDEEAPATSEKASCIPTFAPISRPSTKLDQVSIASISSLLAATAPVKDEAPDAKTEATGPTEAEIEIWESGSAAEEAAANALTDGTELVSIFSS